MDRVVEHGREDPRIECLLDTSLSKHATRRAHTGLDSFGSSSFASSPGRRDMCSPPWKTRRKLQRSAVIKHYSGRFL